MGNKKNNNYLVQGTILTAASIIARVIGMIYRIPLTNIIGQEGNSYYSTANEIYTILLLISSYNLPLAVSKLISERLNNREYKNAYRVFRCALKMSIPVGGAFAIAMFAGAEFIARDLVHNEMAVYGIRILSPALFLVAVLGVVRGFFQGHGNMVPTAVSQVIEQIVNAVVSVAGAAVMIGIGAGIAQRQENTSFEPAFGAAGATIGTIVSVTIALLFLGVIYISYMKRYKKKMRRDRTHKRESSRKIYRAIMITIVPVILSSVLYNITTIVDQSIFNSVSAAQGYSSQQYNIIWGTYSGEFRVLQSSAASLPPRLCQALRRPGRQRTEEGAKRKDRGCDPLHDGDHHPVRCGHDGSGRTDHADALSRQQFAGRGHYAVGITHDGCCLPSPTLTTGVLQGIGKMKIPLVNTASGACHPYRRLICESAVHRNEHLRRHRRQYGVLRSSSAS